eukprot:5579137-Pleurochrysis_carterae.AAC.1
MKANASYCHPNSFRLFMYEYHSTTFYKGVGHCEWRIALQLSRRRVLLRQTQTEGEYNSSEAEPLHDLSHKKLERAMSMTRTQKPVAVNAGRGDTQSQAHLDETAEELLGRGGWLVVVH